MNGVDTGRVDTERVDRAPDRALDRAADRVITRRPGFRSRERFDFGGHHRPGGDPYGALIVFNEDEVADGVGIPMHPHAGVEV